MNKTVIEVGALVFGILLLIGLYIAYTGTGRQFLSDITGKISSLWSNNANHSMNDNVNTNTIMPIDLENAKVLFASL